MSNTQIDTNEAKMPHLTKIMLTPEQAVYDQCSDYTKNNLGGIAKLLAFTVPTAGFILGASIAFFGFDNKPISYLLTLPIGILTYWFLDRLVVMADARKNTKFIDRSRIFISLAFGIFNSFLIDSFFYKGDIAAERQKEITEQQVALQQKTDTAVNKVKFHKDKLYADIDREAAHLRERNNELVAEVEGSGYSHHFGRGAVYEEKRAVLDRETSDFNRRKALLMQEAAKDDSAISHLTAEAEDRKAHVTEQVSTGINHNMELLHKVVFRKPFNMFVSFLFMVICMVLELLPLLAKKYIHISEYFEHAQHHIDAHLETAQMKKDDMIAQELHKTALSSQRKKEAELARHNVQTLQQQMAHHENIVDATDSHFVKLAEKQASLKDRFVDYYEEHIRPVFDNVFRRFRTHHETAFDPIYPEQEAIETTEI